MEHESEWILVLLTHTGVVSRIFHSQRNKVGSPCKSILCGPGPCILTPGEAEPDMVKPRRQPRGGAEIWAGYPSSPRVPPLLAAFFSPGWGWGL